MYSEENRFKTFEERSNQNSYISGKETKNEHTLVPSKDKTTIVSSMNNVPKRLIRYQFNTQRYKKRALDVHRKIGRSFYSKRIDFPGVTFRLLKKQTKTHTSLNKLDWDFSW